MIKSKKGLRLIGAAIVYSYAFATFLPLLWMVITALKPTDEVLSVTLDLLPSRIAWENIPRALEIGNFKMYIVNSFVISITATVITVFINLLAGYSFAKYKFRFKNILFFMVLSTLMIPIQVNMIPNYLIISKLGWLNTYAGVIIPMCGEAFGLFLAKQFISEMPDELIEAMRIDGSKELGIFRNLIIPNSGALISALIILTFMSRWNDFIWVRVAVTEQARYTIQLGLQVLVNMLYFNWNDLMDCALSAVIPIVIVFVIFQKHFIQGVTTTGLKG